MTNFEEDFPSLNGKLPLRVEPESMAKYGDGTLSTQYAEQIITAHCLDKQRVREAINKLSDLRDGEGNHIVYSHELLEELGL